jgi:hypothetical protein
LHLTLIAAGFGAGSAATTKAGVAAGSNPAAIVSVLAQFFPDGALGLVVSNQMQLLADEVIE